MAARESRLKEEAQVATAAAVTEAAATAVPKGRLAPAAGLAGARSGEEERAAGDGGAGGCGGAGCGGAPAGGLLLRPQSASAVMLGGFLGDVSGGGNRHDTTCDVAMERETIGGSAASAAVEEYENSAIRSGGGGGGSDVFVAVPKESVAATAAKKLFASTPGSMAVRGYFQLPSLKKAPPEVNNVTNGSLGCGWGMEWHRAMHGSNVIIFATGSVSTGTKKQKTKSEMSPGCRAAIWPKYCVVFVQMHH